jgi:thiosulfate/3-mercaptopyruvate sulfurtransferase
MIKRLSSAPLAISAAIFFFAVPKALPSDNYNQRGQIVVTADWVAAHLGRPSLVLLEIGEKSDYDKGHIPGARYFDWTRVSTPDGSGLSLELPPVSQLVSVFEDIGVTDKSTVVVYYGKEWVTATARVYLTLDYMGLRGRAFYLDGGLPEWRRTGHQVSTEVPHFEKGKLIVDPRTDVVTNLEYVRGELHQPGVALVDARENDCYSGRRSCHYFRPGHIPGAVNIPVESVIEDDGKLKSKDQLRRIFSSAGVHQGEQVVTYCHIGQRASLLYIIARDLGYDARMYDGSFEEWDSRSDLPVETGTN